MPKKNPRDHVVVFMTLDDQHYQVDMELLGGNYEDSDSFWIANDVRDMSTNMFWSIDPAPMGDTPGECLDAVIKEARR